MLNTDDKKKIQLDLLDVLKDSLNQGYKNRLFPEAESVVEEEEPEEDMVEEDEEEDDETRLRRALGE